MDMAATTAFPAEVAATAVSAEAAAAHATRLPAEASPAGRSSSPLLDDISALGLPPLRACPHDLFPLPLSSPPGDQLPLLSPPFEQAAVPPSPGLVLFEREYNPALRTARCLHN